MSQSESRETKLQNTGTGIGGNGGLKHGRVKGIVLEGIGHLVAMETPNKCAQAAAVWLKKEMQGFEQQRKAYLTWTQKSLIEKQTLSDEWKRRAKGPAKSKI